MAASQAPARCEQSRSRPGADVPSTSQRPSKGALPAASLPRGEGALSGLRRQTGLPGAAPEALPGREATSVASGRRNRSSRSHPRGRRRGPESHRQALASRGRVADRACGRPPRRKRGPAHRTSRTTGVRTPCLLTERSNLPVRGPPGKRTLRGETTGPGAPGVTPYPSSLPARPSGEPLSGSSQGRTRGARSCR